MTDKIITQKDVEHVAKLARIALSDNEKERYEEQLGRILEYVGKLKQINTDAVPATAHPLETFNVCREDEAQPFPDIPALFKNAPETEETFYKVKKVIE